MNKLPKKKDYMFLYTLFYIYVKIIVLYCTMVNFEKVIIISPLLVVSSLMSGTIFVIIQCLGQYLLNICE